MDLEYLVDQLVQDQDRKLCRFFDKSREVVLQTVMLLEGELDGAKDVVAELGD